MPFPAGSAARDPDAYLSPLACALEARLQRRGFAPAPPGERVGLWFEPSALTGAELDLLERADGATLERKGTGLARLVLAPAVLGELAGRSDAARCLLAALEAASTVPEHDRVLGILNVTSDSFSDGGQFLEASRAVEQGRALLAEGADWIDVGGESTRPGAEPVPAEVERERVLPVIAALREARARLSVDTTKAGVAQAALEAGAEAVNDVSAGRNDPAMLPLVAEHGAALILMHAQGTPRTMQTAPRYQDVVREVAAHLRERARAAWQAGVEPARIALDPGFGFGKLLEHNLELMRALPELRSLGFPLCVGLSRKSFLGRLTGLEEPRERDEATRAATALAAYLGAELHRVHTVRSVRSALAIARALCR